MLDSAWVYILTNKNNTTLYIGVTNDLSARLSEHKKKQNPTAFTARYNLFKLVYYQGFTTLEEAIEMEGYIKGKSRRWKMDLINTLNPTWKDLADDIAAQDDDR